jgi:hypothetical protein
MPHPQLENKSINQDVTSAEGCGLKVSSACPRCPRFDREEGIRQLPSAKAEACFALEDESVPCAGLPPLEGLRGTGTDTRGGRGSWGIRIVQIIRPQA